MKMTLTDRRTQYLKNLKLDDTVDSQGGTPSGGWTRAAHLAGLRSTPYWSGFLPTPARHFSANIVTAMFNAPESLRVK